ncbi:hypothetical protein HOLleu_35492 [Holothuria leucospilota]|uniref:Uncharacterized protein n=1 Tax=Holothuria leucospilota TaxID=206669 RepID=A0A9Q0YPI0_HOLLE|nr:hypothetical protein HOLleu_35492 [Holothuria leucospilota]
MSRSEHRSVLLIFRTVVDRFNVLLETGRYRGCHGYFPRQYNVRDSVTLNLKLAVCKRTSFVHVACKLLTKMNMTNNSSAYLVSHCTNDSVLS